MTRENELILQAPDANSFTRMAHLDTLLQQQQQQTSALLAQHPNPSVSVDSQQSSHSILEQQQQQHEADMTYATASSFDDPPPKAPPKSAMKKPSGMGVGTVKKATAGTAAMRKKRELEIAGYIETLPLEYRGREPVSHRYPACPLECLSRLVMLCSRRLHSNEPRTCRPAKLTLY